MLWWWKNHILNWGPHWASDWFWVRASQSLQLFFILSLGLQFRLLGAKSIVFYNIMTNWVSFQWKNFPKLVTTYFNKYLLIILLFVDYSCSFYIKNPDHTVKYVWKGFYFLLLIFNGHTLFQFYRSDLILIEVSKLS